MHARMPARRRQRSGAPIELIRYVLRSSAAFEANIYFARNLPISGDRNERRRFLVSPRPVSCCATFRKVSVVR